MCTYRPHILVLGPLIRWLELGAKLLELVSLCKEFEKFLFVKELAICLLTKETPLPSLIEEKSLNDCIFVFKKY